MAAQTMSFRLFTLCSSCISALVIVLSDGSKNRKMADLSNFERGQIVGARLAGASMTKTAMLLGVSRVTVSKVMLAYTNHEKTTPAKRNSGQKSVLMETDHRTLRRIF
jgi:preprotein translocase subunit SecG